MGLSFRRGVVFTIGVATALASCTFGDLSEFSSGGPRRTDGGHESGGLSHDDASTSGGASGDAKAPPGDAAQGDASEGVTCAGKAGPKMVRVGSYCVDSTEVTGAHYAAFVAAGVDIKSQPPECAFNKSFAPSTAIAADDLPARFVNWCDARAYCVWAGKRLCGAMGGGPTPYENPDLTTEEWFMACSQNNARVFSYGQTVDPTACNADPATGQPVSVASKTHCEGGFAGLFDMSGNVREWQNACKTVSDGGGSESCVARGGASDDLPADTTCDHRETNARSYGSIHLGFRCCSDAL